MSIVFTKKYSGKIKRAISEGQICPSTLPEYFIEKESSIRVESNNNKLIFPTKIMNVIKKDRSVEITTNTLGLDITDVVVNGKPYYKKLSVLASDVKVLSGYDYMLLDNTYYINTTEDYIVDGENLIYIQDVISINLWDRSEKVSIRRLKDRFKITVKTQNPSELKISLKTDSIFSPTYHNNWLTFYDCTFRNSSNKDVFLYTQSFEYYDKTEIHEKINTPKLKDKVISNILVESIGDNYYKISYKTYRSNLCINTDLLTSAYIILKELHSQYVLEVEQVEPQETNNTITKISRLPTEIKKVEINPYLEIPRYKGRSERMYFVWETNSKYATSFNTPLGCERVVLDINKLITNKTENIISSGGSIIKENNKRSSNTIYQTTPYTGSNNLTTLLDYLK